MGDGAGHAAREHAGADVRPADAARPQHHRRDAAAELRRHRLLQVGAHARGRRPVADHRRDDHVGEPVGADPARRLRRAARLLLHRRRRDLRRRLRARAGPHAAARPDARQRDGGGDRHAGRVGHRARARPLRLRADRAMPGARSMRQQTRALRRSGTEGRRVLRDIDTYLAGINRWYSANRPDARAFDRGDIYALNAIKGQFLGQGGGQEVENALFYDAARDRFGARRGAQVYEDLRQRNDPETSTTTSRSARSPDARPGAPPARHGAARRRQLPLGGRRAAGPGRSGFGGVRADRGVEHAARRRRPLRGRHADLRRRPADRLQLPRPDARDGPLRAEHPLARLDLGAVPRLRADRPHGRLRVDDHRGRRGHRRHVRRAALRRLAHALRVPRPLPPDGARERRHDRPQRRRGPRSLPAHGARAGRRLRARRGHEPASSRWRASAPPTVATRPTSCSTSGSPTAA